MKENVTSAWDEVGSKLSGLGQKLRYHVEQASDDDGSDVKDALHKLGAAVEDAFEGLRNATKDPAIKDDVKSVANSLSEAISSTVNEVSDTLRSTLKRDS